MFNTYSNEFAIRRSSFEIHLRSFEDIISFNIRYFQKIYRWDLFQFRKQEKIAFISVWSSPCRAASTDTPRPHSPRSLITSGWSSGLHLVSLHSCWMYVRAGRPAFARPYVGVHRSTSLMSSSLLLQQCPACLARLTWIVFEMRGRWPYSWCLVECCCLDLFNIARNIV